MKSQFIILLLFSIITLGISQQQCLTQVPNCAQCASNSTSTCTSCNTNYTLNTNGDQCILCALEYCQTCSQPNVCTKCKTTDYTQFKLVPGSDVVTCIKCNTNSCARCQENFFCTECSNDASGKSRKPDQNGQNCFVCQVPNCKHCSGVDMCRVCQNGYKLNLQDQCTICKVNNCQSCSSDDFCQKCSEGWSLDSTGKCIKCQYPCKTCNADGSCNTCDYPLYNLAPSAMAANNKQCFKPSVGNCQSHSQNNNTQCLACKDFYDLVSSQNSCVLKCDQNCLTCDSVNKSKCLSCRQFQYLTSTNTCQNCSPGKRSDASNPAACLLAQIGFFIFNGQAKQCPSYCKACQNQTVCTELVKTEGETLILSSSSQSFQLAKCSGNCLTCSQKNPQICVQCYQGLYLSSGVCKQCASQCKTCDPTAPEKCISCPLNQFLSSERCIACNSNCLTCQSATALTACTSCKNGFWLNRNTKVCVSGCPANCLSCSSATSCEKCNTGYTTLLEPTTGTYTCTPCGTNCRKCMEGNPDVCLDCGDGFSTLTGQTCVQLSAFCKKGLGSLCTQCLAGYQLFTGSTCSLECQFPCATCTTPTSCTSCIGGYIYDSLTKSCSPKTNCNGACNICPLGYSLSFGNCVQCTSANCQRCDTATPSQCFSCLNGYYLDGSGACQKCSAQCKSCISSSKCLSCVSGYYYTSTFQCQACSTAAKCLTCYNQPTQCSSCASGYDLVGWKCKKQCSFISTCLGCDEQGVCIACPTGYTLRSNSGTGGQPCLECNVTNCLSCFISANTCSQCQNGYYLDTSGKCQKCLTANCNICYSANTCFDCKIGFIVTDNGTCSSCLIPNCKDCFSDTICKQCNAGYTTDISTGQCFICNLTNCDKCVSKDQCDVCKTGFVLNYDLGTCQTCKIPNCDECQTSNYCKTCKTGYSHDSLNGVCIECNVTGCSKCITANLCSDACANGTTSVVSVTNPNQIICVPCAIKDCTYCLWDNYCYTCDTSVNQFNSPDVNGQNCISCNVANCAVCSTANVCVLCLHPFGLNSANKCVNCVVDNCQQCSSFGFCSKCVEGYATSPSGSCVSCPDDCQTCSPDRECKTCKQPKFNYYPSQNSSNKGKCFKKTISNCRYHDTKNNSKCSQCNTFYKYNTTTDTCNLQCDFACKTCNPTAPKVCLSCKDQAFLNGTTCSPCPNGCKTCTTADNCTELEAGYFINDKGRIRSCGKKCKKCTSQTRCTQLEDGQSQGKALFSAGGNSSQSQILICTSTCKKCQTTQKCLDCNDGFYLKLQSSRDKEGICFPCNPKCKSCDKKDPNICLSCFENSFLSNRTCAQCNSNCLTCKGSKQPDVCTSCRDGFYLDKTTNKCAQGCPLNCIACASLTQCTNCTTGYTTYQDTDTESTTFNQTICTPCVLSCRLCAPGQPSNCISCGEGFYKNGGDCIACPSNCKTCTETGCTDCIEKYDLVVKDVQTNEKVCAPSCIRPCTQCVIGSPRNCTKCQAGFTFNGVSGCNVAACGSTGCVICSTGFVLVKSTKTCQKCTVSNCQKCQELNRTKCLTCGLTYYLDDSLNTCVSCPSQCTECFSETQCTQCADGYVLDTKRNRRGFKCEKCQDKCKTCKGNPSKCASCSAGFELNGWKCQKAFKAQMNFKFDTTVKQFNRNSRTFLALILRALGYTDPDKFSFESIKQGSVDLVSSAALPGEPGSLEAAESFRKLTQAVSGQTVAGMSVLSGGVEVKGGSLTSEVSMSNLGIILGVTIPLGILLIVGIVLFIVYKSKNKDGFKYSDNEGTQRPTGNESYSKAKIEYEDNSLI